MTPYESKAIQYYSAIMRHLASGGTVRLDCLLLCGARLRIAARRHEPGSGQYTRLMDRVSDAEASYRRLRRLAA